MTKKKLTLIILSSILAIILITVVICAIIANSKNDDSEPTAELACWQGMIKDETLLKDVVIAGAHDAGTKGISYLAETQDRDVYNLLKCGTRYLDLRVAYAQGKLLVYHGPFKGVTLESALTSVRQFLAEHPTENVILDFQHFDEKELEAQTAIVKLLQNTMTDILVAVNAFSLSDKLTIADGLTMGDVRGKAIVTWGWENDEALSLPYIFKRDNDAGGRKYSALHSFYYGQYNKKSSAKYIEEGLPYYLGFYKDPAYSKGLRVLQGQLTDGLFVFGPRFREATHTDNMNKYLDGLKTDDDLAYVNIVIRDFVTPSKNCHTLQLNLYKGVVKSDKTTDFEKMIAENIKK